MSQKQICDVTLAALSEWAASTSKEAFGTWCANMKKRGFYWGADETLEDSPNVLA